MYIRLSKHIHVCIYIYIHIHTYIYRYSCPIWLYNAILGYFMLFLRYLIFFLNFRTRDMKHLTKISMVGAF